MLSKLEPVCVSLSLTGTAVEDFAARIEALAVDRDRRHELGHLARKWVIEDGASASGIRSSLEAIMAGSSTVSLCPKAKNGNSTNIRAILMTTTIVFITVF